jgi:hypothetical protein
MTDDKLHKDLIDALCDALPIIEDLLHEPIYKKGFIAGRVRKIKAVLKLAGADKVEP